MPTAVTRHRGRVDIGTRDETEDSAAQVGALLRAARDRAALTQTELARKAGVSQATVSAVERGRRRPSLPLTEQILGALGLQLRLATEPADQSEAELDAAIAALLATPLADRLRAPKFDGPALLRILAPADPVVEGAAAAVLQGAPVPWTVLEVAIERARLTDFTDVVRRCYADRWSDTWERWSAASRDPQAPGSPRWWVPAGEFRVRMVDERPVSFTVLVDDLPVAVRPLHEIAATNRHVRRALTRLSPP